MVIFELVKSVLDEAYVNLSEQQKTELDEQVRTEFGRLGASYKNLHRGMSPDYSTSAARIAYSYKYLSAHANYLFQIITLAQQDLLPLLNTPTPAVCSIGGGPGSDVLGVVKFLARRRCKCQLYARVYDGSLDWVKIFNLSLIHI